MNKPQCRCVIMPVTEETMSKMEASRRLKGFQKIEKMFWTTVAIEVFILIADIYRGEWWGAVSVIFTIGFMLFNWFYLKNYRKREGIGEYERDSVKGDY